MIAAVRPVWSEGMLLGPHHLQQSDLFHEQLLDARLNALHAAPWGVLSLALDPAALAAGDLRVAAFSGVLPDGTPLRIDPHASTRPAGRAIAPHFPTRAESLLVYLALPLLREGVANLASEPGAPVRLRGVTRRVVDLTGARNERELHAAEPAPVLLFADEPRDDVTALPLAELVRDESGGFTTSPSFIPPCLALAAAPVLGADLRDLLSRALARRRRLAEERRARPSQRPELTARDLDRALQLHALDRSLPWLRHCLDADADTSPRVVYHALVDLAGALLSAAAEGDPEALPAFAYTDLRATFQPLLHALRRLLGRDLEPLHVEVPLRPHQGNSWLGELKDERLAACARYLLVVEPEAGDLVVAANEIPAVTKIASWKRIPAIVRQNALGVPIRATLRPPPELPQSPRAVYFTIDTRDPQWHELLAERRVAIYLRAPYDPQRARVRLLALPDAEPER